MKIFTGSYFAISHSMMLTQCSIFGFGVFGVVVVQHTAGGGYKHAQRGRRGVEPGTVLVVGGAKSTTAFQLQTYVHTCLNGQLKCETWQRGPW